MMTSKIDIYILYETQKGKDVLESCVKKEHYLELKKMENNLNRFQKIALQDHSDIVIIENNENNPSLLTVLEQLSKNGINCIVFSEFEDSDRILSAFRMGAREYLINGPQLEQSFKNAIIRLTADTQSDTHHKKAHKIALIGAKGGTGVSHLSVNLAWTFSHSYHARTLLVDLDITGAKDAFMLDLVPEKNLLEFMTTDINNKQSLAHQLLTHVSPNFSLLPLPENPADTESITAEQIKIALDALETYHDIILMDLSHHLHELTLMGIDSTNSLILVMDPTVMSVKAGIQKIQLIEKMGVERENIHIVINRYNRKQALVPLQLSKTLNSVIFDWLPNDEKRLTRAENIGKPVCFSYPRCKYSKKIDQIADKLLVGNEDNK
jgi:pilus assembly protein CpaE